jgi:hypothetical protein
MFGKGTRFRMNDFGKQYSGDISGCRIAEEAARLE